MIPLYTDANIVPHNKNIFFGANATDPNQATGIYSYQTDVQNPYDASTFYLARPLNAGNGSSSTSSAGSSNSTSASFSTSASQTSASQSSSTQASTTSSSSSTAVSGSYLWVLAVALVVMLASGAFAYTRKRPATR